MLATDPTSLARLHDIVLPPPVSWWPPAPGWLWLAGIVAVAALAALLRLLARWQRRRYRREALAEVARLEERLKQGESAAGVVEGLSVVLKRTAITAYTRGRVAHLSGPAWFAFLDRTGGTRFGETLGARMEHMIYKRSAPDEATVRRIGGEVRAWIRGHAASDGDGPASADSGTAAAQAAARSDAARSA